MNILSTMSSEMETGLVLAGILLGLALLVYFRKDRS
jgi:LPXTG-motif cell wall-anchored protein